VNRFLRSIVLPNRVCLCLHRFEMTTGGENKTCAHSIDLSLSDGEATLRQKRRAVKTERKRERRKSQRVNKDPVKEAGVT